MSSSTAQPPSPQPWAELARAQIQALDLTLTTAQYQSIGKGLSRLNITDHHQPTDSADFQQTLQQVRHV